MTHPYQGPPQATQPACYAHPDRPAYVLCQRCERPICGPCMTQAPVGYQCPTCVREGNRGMRRVRSYAGMNRSFGQNATTLTLIILNVALWLAVMVTGGSNSKLVPMLAIHRQGMCLIPDGSGWSAYAVSAANCAANGGSFQPGVLDGGYWQLLTSAFLHVQVLHIGFNMLALWVLGPGLEQLFGRVRFLVVYLGSALVGSFAVAFLSDPLTLSLGASGAIFGLMAAVLLTAIKYHGDVRGILTWIGLNAVITVMNAGISWQAHLGGFLGGLLFGALILWGPLGEKRRR